MNIIRLKADEIENYDLIVSLLKGKDEITIYDINDFRENKTKLLLDEFAKLFNKIHYIPLVEIYSNQRIKTDTIYDITNMYPNIPLDILNKIVPILMFSYIEDDRYVWFGDKLLYKYNKIFNCFSVNLPNKSYYVIDLLNYSHDLTIHYNEPAALPVIDTLCNYGALTGYEDKYSHKMLIGGSKDSFLIEMSGLISNEIYLSRSNSSKIINISNIRFRYFWKYIPFEILGNYIIIPEGSKPSLSIYKNYGIIPVIIEELDYDRNTHEYLYQISTGMDTNFIRTKEKYNSGKLEMICLK